MEAMHAENDCARPHQFPMAEAPDTLAVATAYPTSLKPTFKTQAAAPAMKYEALFAKDFCKVELFCAR